MGKASSATTAVPLRGPGSNGSPWNAAANIGWIQCYLARDNTDETEYWWGFGIDDDAAGIDYLIANPGDRRRGLGSVVIRGFASFVFERHPEWAQVCAGPFDANAASWKVLEKAGFRCVGIIDDEDGPCRLMVLDRPALSAEGRP